jgi:outer membrane protein assembly factor BamB
MKCSAARFLFAVLLLTPFAAPVARAENWPQWRGPGGDGISHETNVPVEWDAVKNVAWKVKMPGMGSGTPAVWGDRIFVTSEDGDDLALVCLNTDGKELWKRKLSAGRNRFMRGEGNNASPSPSTDGERVYCYFGTGDLVCVDFAGKEVWRFNAQERYGKFRIQHGMHQTPYLYGDRLYLVLLHSGGHWIVALDKGTGKEVWKVARQSDARFENEHSYASPFVCHRGKDAYLVVHGNDYTTAHRLSDGGEIWRLTGLNAGERYHPTLRFVASPAVTPDLIVVPTAKNGPVFAVQADATGTIAPDSPHVAWRRPRDTPDVPCPLIHGGLVYLCRENGVLICLDAKTGEEHYQKPLHRALYRASPVYADGKVYFTARDGVITVVKAGPKFEQLGVNKLVDPVTEQPETITASPVVSGGRIYLRGWETLYAIGPGGR